MSVTRIVSLLACLAGSALAWVGAGDVEGDARRLDGKWFARTPGLVWEVNFQVGRAVQIAMSGSAPTFTRAGVGRLTGVQEDARGRFVDLEESTARATDLPRRLYFRFEGDALILDISEGPLAGRHTFCRRSWPNAGLHRLCRLCIAHQAT